MLELQGIPASPGVAIGPALVLDSVGYRIERSTVAADQAANEAARLAAAVDGVASDLKNNQRETSGAAGNHTGDIFAAHLQMLSDPRLASELSERILVRHQTADYAVSRVFYTFANSLKRLRNPILSERAQDVLDVQRQLLTHLGAIADAPLANLDSDAIVIANNLTPSETANLDREFVRGFCTETGGSGGHTAIVAKGLELPAVVGIGPFIDQIDSHCTVIVDGDQGKVIFAPDQETLSRYRDLMVRRRTLSKRLEELRDLPAETADGVRLTVSANIEFPHETAACLANGADGIGLYRTEFLYLASDDEPSEEEHYQVYRRVVEALGGRPIVIRTLDLGADKIAKRAANQSENNPFLGLRSIRLSLRNLELFRPQLRAILRAAVHGDVRVMFPLVTTLGELRQARMVMNTVADDLESEGIPHRSDIKTGMMVEVPAAVTMLESFVHEVDFLSIGTNDLAQYALAVDRTNPLVAELYQSSDPAVVRMVRHCVEVANRAEVPLSVCGEMSSNPARALLLIGLGVRNLSVPPSSLPIIKKVIRSVTLADCQEAAARVMKLEAARDVDMFLTDRLECMVPELVLS
ncbi:MAG: phosphoenolpyruvate--protein phosphotransferase [Planctomycetota bacterium]